MNLLLKLLNSIKTKLVAYRDNSDRLPAILPIIVLSKEEADLFLQGHVTLKPLCSIASEIVENLKRNYPNNKINTSEICSVGLSMFSLFYKNGRYERISKNFEKLGEWSIVVYPRFFYEILEPALLNSFSFLRRSYVTKVIYKKKLPPTEEFNLSIKIWNERWKNEILFVSAYADQLCVPSLDLSPIHLNLGDLSSYAVKVKTSDLIKGKFPSEIMEDGFQYFLNQFCIKTKKIKGWTFSVLAELKEIVPTNYYIEKFRKVLPEEKWFVSTSIEKLFVDSAPCPRISFNHKNNLDCIDIGINKITFSYKTRVSLDVEEIKSVLEVIDSIIPNKNDHLHKFCIMSLTTEANLGTVREEIALNSTKFQEEYTADKNGLMISRHIETEFNLIPNYMLNGACQLCWHYFITTSLPCDECVPYYSINDVMLFLVKAQSYNVSDITQLLKDKPYRRFKYVQQHRRCN